MSRKILLVEALLLITATTIAYAPSWWNGFVYDDENYILRNPRVHGTLDLPKIFTETYPPDTRDRAIYRPLVTLSFYVDGKLWGFAAQDQWNGFHLTNSLLHSLNTCLLLLILRFFRMSSAPRMAACLIFGLHPVSTEAVAWIVGRAELLGMNFGLIAVLSFLRRPRGIGLVATCACWIFAMLCKEHWIVLPGLITLLCVLLPANIKSLFANSPLLAKEGLGEVGRDRGTPCSPPCQGGHLKRRMIWRWGCLALFTGIGFWAIRSMIVGSWHAPVSAYGSISAPARMATALAILWKYVGLWFWPVPLSVYHEIHPLTRFGESVVPVAGWLFVFWLMWRARSIFPWFTLAMSWFWVLLLPVSNLIIPIGTISGERFIYPATLFFAPALVVGLNKVFSVMFQASAHKPSKIFLLTIGCLLLSVRLWTRLDDWKTNLSLWTSTAKAYPQSYGVKVQLAAALLGEKRFFEAHVVATEALRQAEKTPQPYQKYLQPRLLKVEALAREGMRRRAQEQESSMPVK